MTTSSTEATLQSRTRLLAVAVLLLTLIAGIGIGWALHRPHGPPGFSRGGPRPEMARAAPGAPGHRFGDRLNLTAAQEQQVDSIFAASRAEIAAFWEGPGARLRQIIDSTSIKMRAVLDSTQRVKFDQMQQRREKGRGRGPWEGGRRAGPGMQGSGGAPIEGPPPPRNR
jgi:Spy/CpxP family protein refolding chaperone